MADRLRLAALVALTCLASACGDDLESRNAAATGARENPPAVPVAQDTPRPAATTRASTPTAPADGEPVVVDAQPDDLLDDAEGFSAEPMDDASGIDPTPVTAEEND